MRKSIKHRLILSYVILSTGPIVLVGLLLSAHYFLSQRNQVLSFQKERVLRVSNEVDSFIKVLREKMSMVVNFTEVQGLSDAKQEELLNMIMAHEPSFRVLALLDEFGFEKAIVSRNRIYTKDDLSDHSQKKEYLIPQETKKTYFGPVEFEETTGTPSVVLAVPFVHLRNMKVNGVLVAQVNLKAMWDLIAELPYMKGERAYILNNQGRLIAHPNPSLVLKGTYFKPPTQDGFHTGLNNTSSVIASKQIDLGTQSLTVVSERDSSMALSAAIKSLWIIVPVLGLIFLIANGVGVIVIRRLITPIQHLTSHVHSIQSFEHAKEIDIQSDNEVGELADAFNGMTRNLKKLHKDLEDEIEKHIRTKEEIKTLNKDLEFRVIERTNKLEESNKKLKEATVQLVQSAKLSALGELTAGVAHELNQPLNSIKIISQSLMRDIEKDQFQEDSLEEDLGDIIHQVNKMAEIIDHMRLYTRQSDVISKESVDVNAVIESALILIGQQLANHDIQLVKTLDPDLPDVQGDPIQLEQVLQNLITNARHALESCEKEDKIIELSTYEMKAQPTNNHPLIVVEVKDNGTGIPQDVKEKIFQPFFTTKEPGKGTGLGLSISGKIVEEHDGKLELESEMGQGTSFKVVLPGIEN